MLAGKDKLIRLIKKKPKSDLGLFKVEWKTSFTHVPTHVQACVLHFRL